MVTCAQICDVPDRLYIWITRQRYIRPIYFILCGIIFLTCLLGLYACDRYKFQFEIHRREWKGFLWSALALDTFIFCVLALNRRAHNRLVSAYEEI